MEKLVGEDTPHVHPWVLWRVISLFVLVNHAQGPSFNFVRLNHLGTVWLSAKAKKDQGHHYFGPCSEGPPLNPTQISFHL